MAESESILNDLSDQNKVKKVAANTGHLWKVLIQ
jgi:hypothetical protein